MGKYATAAKELLRKLYKDGLRGGPVSQPTKRDPVITVYGMGATDIEKLPKTFHGFRVEGTTEKPNYDRNQLRDLIRATPRKG